MTRIDPLATPVPWCVVAVTLVLLASFGPAAAVDCRDYSSDDYLLRTPRGLTSVSTKIAEWNDMLVVLRPEGLQLIDLSDPRQPTDAGFLAGSFSDFALGSDTVILGTAGNLFSYSLPDLQQRSSYWAPYSAEPFIACDGERVFAGFGDHFMVFRLPGFAVVSNTELAQIDSFDGTGLLTLHDNFVVGCMDSGLGNLHPRGRLSVIDIANPEAPVMTDYLAAPPWAGSGETSMFFGIEPWGDGMVLSGLVNGTGVRPQFTSLNRQYLARLDIDADGHLVWLGRVEDVGPSNSGFALSGDRALWVVGDLNHSVDLSPELESPALHGADHHFRGGRLRYLPERQTLAGADRLYHVADIREADVPGSAPHWPSYAANIVEMEYPFFITWSASSDMGGEHWAVGSYDRRTSPPTLIDSVGDSGWATFYPTRCVPFDRQLYLTSASSAKRIELGVDGQLSEPVDVGTAPIRCSIRWDGFIVAATTDSLKVCELQDGGGPTVVAGLPWPQGSTSVYLFRAGDFLFASDAGASVYCFDLSDIHNPMFLYGTAGWSASLRYSPDWNLLFEFGNSFLRWRALGDDGVPLPPSTWSTPFPSMIRDIDIHGGILYLLLDVGGLAVYAFDPVTGPTPIGADLSVAAKRLFPVGNDRYLLAPYLIERPLHCTDPLPVSVTGFRAEPNPNGVHVSWYCATDEFVGAGFEVVAEEAREVRRVVCHAAGPGGHEAIDTQAAGTEAIVYSLYLVRTTGERSLLDSFTLDAWRNDGRQFALVAAPNPLNPRTSIRYSLPAAAPVRLRVFDLAGRVVRTLVEGAAPEGESTVEWDGCDEVGSRVGSGTYIAHLESDRRSASVRLQLIR